MNIDKIVNIRGRLIDILLKLRKNAGYWEGVLNSDVQSTSAAIIALHLNGEKESVKKGLKFIESCQNADGGWGYAPRVQSDMDSSIAALSALLICTKDSQYVALKRKGFKYCDKHDFNSEQLLSKLFLYFSGIEDTLKLPSVNVEELPHPEQMMFDLFNGLKMHNAEIILRHSKSTCGLRSWRGLTVVTGLACSALTKMGIKDKMANLWLQKTQNDDGGFPHTHSLAVWDTVIASLALMDVGINPQSSQWLLSVQDIGGGWYWDADNMGYVDLDDTGYAVLVLLMNGNSISNYRIQRALKLLISNQNEDGGFPTFERENKSVKRSYWNCSVPDVTAHVLKALKVANLDTEAEQAEKWLIKNSIDGIWKGFWFKGDLYSTASVLEAINKELISLDKVQKQILAQQNIDGGFGIPKSTIEETAWGISALIEVENYESDALRDAIKWLYNKITESLENSLVGALPLFRKHYSDSLFPIVFTITAFTKYLKLIGGKEFDKGI